MTDDALAKLKRHLDQAKPVKRKLSLTERLIIEQARIDKLKAHYARIVKRCKS
jgi:hypothetical protein